MSQIFISAETAKYRGDGTDEVYLSLYGPNGGTRSSTLSLDAAIKLRDELLLKLPPTAPAGIVEAARLGHAALKLARDCFRSACAERTLERVQLALSSAKGAVRHAEMKALRKMHWSLRPNPNAGKAVRS